MILAYFGRRDHALYTDAHYPFGEEEHVIEFVHVADDACAKEFKVD